MSYSVIKKKSVFNEICSNNTGGFPYIRVCLINFILCVLMVTVTAFLLYDHLLSFAMLNLNTMSHCVNSSTESSEIEYI